MKLITHTHPDHPLHGLQFERLLVALQHLFEVFIPEDGKYRYFHLWWCMLEKVMGDGSASRSESVTTSVNSTDYSCTCKGPHVSSGQKQICRMPCEAACCHDDSQPTPERYLHQSKSSNLWRNNAHSLLMLSNSVIVKHSRLIVPHK